MTLHGDTQGKQDSQGKSLLTLVYEQMNYVWLRNKSLDKENDMFALRVVNSIVGVNNIVVAAVDSPPISAKNDDLNWKKWILKWLWQYWEDNSNFDVERRNVGRQNEYLLEPFLPSPRLVYLPRRLLDSLERDL